MGKGVQICYFEVGYFEAASLILHFCSVYFWNLYLVKGHLI